MAAARHRRVLRAHGRGCAGDVPSCTVNRTNYSTAGYQAYSSLAQGALLHHAEVVSACQASGCSAAQVTQRPFHVSNALPRTSQNTHAVLHAHGLKSIVRRFACRGPWPKGTLLFPAVQTLPASLKTQPRQLYTAGHTPSLLLLHRIPPSPPPPPSSSTAAWTARFSVVLTRSRPCQRSFAGTPAASSSFAP